MINNFIPEAKLISLLARINLDGDYDGKINKLIEDVGNKSDRFFTLCQYHEVIPLVYNNLKRFDNQAARQLLDLLQNQYYSDLAYSVYLENEYLNLAKILYSRNINFIPLKGIVFYKEIYSDLNMRSMCDIDILIREDELEKVEQVLKDVGYEKDLGGLSEDYWLNDHCHLMFRKDRVLLEVHWDLAFRIPRKIQLSQIWERAKEIDLDGLKIKRLSPEDTIIALALHQRRFNKPLCLKNVCDLSALLKKYKEINWDYLIRVSGENGMLSCIYFILLQAKFLLGANITEEILLKFKISPLKRKMMLNVLNNTFSEKIILDHENRKSLYLKLNFLFYDNIFEFLRYIFWLPQEKFAKYCRLAPYSQKTALLYRLRWYYLPIKIIKHIFRERG